MDGWAPSLGRCIECKDTGFTYVPGLIISAILIVISVAYYTASWSPLLEDPDKPENRLLAKIKRYEWEKIRDAMKGTCV